MTKSAAPKLMKTSPGRLHTIPHNFIIRNCMELSGILTVQSLCLLMIPSPKKSIFLYKKATIAPPPGPTIGSVDASGHIKPMHAYYTSTSLPGFSPTRPTEQERERPWKTLVTCLPESGRLQTNNLGEGQVSVRFVSTEHRQVSAAMKVCT